MKMNFDKKVWDIASDIESNSALMVVMMCNIEQDRAGSIDELDALLESIICDAKKMRELLK